MFRKLLYLSGILFFAVNLLGGGVERVMLHNGWRFKQVRGRNWYSASIPGVVQTDLMAHEIIPDPFIGMNERAVQWVDKEDWEYETTFTLTTEVLASDNLSLVFDGLDTYADVYLNDEKVIVADNMFRSWRTACKDKLVAGKNKLRVFFHSPIKHDLPKALALDYAYPAVNDQSENGGMFDYKVSVFARKAGYNYGWDWGPRLVTIGIWRPVYIEYWNDMRFDDVHISTSNVTKQSADVEVVIDVNSSISSRALMQIVDADDGRIYADHRIEISGGTNRFEHSFTLKNPELWWSNGLGKPYLYNFKVQIKQDDKVFDSRVVPTGIRSIRLVTDRDMDGEGSTFYFELNGIPVFMKGANYIPNDSFLPRVTKERYRNVVARAVDANMNMLRVWGGGIYEDDYFYELCDKYGILIWQDFMFACSLYPCDDKMAENIRAEAVENVKRLRNHACLALWCGNNEINEAWYSWGWKSRFEKAGVAQKLKGEYDRVFLDILPSVVKDLDPETDYRSSSPFSDLYPEERNDKSGDRHYWNVWHGKEPFTTYEEVIPRFMSEFGFQSFPELSTIKRYNSNEKKWDIESDVMLAHQRHPCGNELVGVYMKRNYREPKDYRSFLYMSQLLQADGMRLALEAHRRNMPYCMGTLYWQHNDCWPVASWSTSDYYGNWKASHYRTRRSFEDVIVSTTHRDNQVEVYVVSDLLRSMQGEINLKLLNFQGIVLREHNEKVEIASNSSQKVLDLDYGDLLGANFSRDVFVCATFKSEGVKAQSIYFFELLKVINLPDTKIRKHITAFDGGYAIRLSVDKLARGVYLSADDEQPLFFSDNYFDMLPESSRLVVVRTSMPKAEFESKLQVMSMCDAIK